MLLSPVLRCFLAVSAQKLFRDAKLSWFNEKSWYIAIFTWPLINGRCTNQLLWLRPDIISPEWACLEVIGCGSHPKTSVVCADHWGRRDFFFCQCPSLARCRNRLFSSLFVVSLTELLSTDIKGIALFIKFLLAGSPVCGCRFFDF